MQRNTANKKDGMAFLASASSLIFAARGNTTSMSCSMMNNETYLFAFSSKTSAWQGPSSEHQQARSLLRNGVRSSG